MGCKGYLVTCPYQLGSLSVFFRHITPRRFDLLEELHRQGEMSINALAQLLKRNYKNVHDDVKALKEIGLIERQENGLYSVPWDEVHTTLKLAV